MFKNVMVAFDGSELAEKALQMGVEIATQSNSKLHVFHTNIIAATLSAQAMNSPSLQDMLNTAGENCRAKAEELLADATCEYEIVVQNAPSPSRPIIDYSEKHDIDLIIMGSRGLGTMKQYFGSVAHSVLNVTRIPTLVIKE